MAFSKQYEETMIFLFTNKTVKPKPEEMAD